MPLFFKFVPTSTTAILETFGKFTKTKGPGINFYIPFVQKITPISNRLKQDNFKFEVKTKDNVFANLNIAVQYRITELDTEKAFYSLSDPIKQIDSLIENTVRAKAPKMELDQLFESQDDICIAVSEKLSKTMSEFGYTIAKTLVTSIEPNNEVKNAMNKINASKRLKEAAINEADADYIKKIREAEADRDRKRLQGEGISQQRLAIMKGYQEGVDNLAKNFGLNPQVVIDFVMKTQHLDTIASIGKSNNTKTIFVDHNPINMFGKKIIEANETNYNGKNETNSNEKLD